MEESTELTPEDLALFVQGGATKEEGEEEQKEEETQKEEEEEEIEIDKANEEEEEEGGKEEEEEEEEEEEKEESTNNKNNEEEQVFELVVKGQPVKLTKEDALRLAEREAERELEPELNKITRFLKQNNITAEELALLNDIRQGNLDAIAAVIPKDRIEELSNKLEEEIDYKPKFEVGKETPLEKNINKLEEDADLANGINTMLEVVPKEEVLAILASDDATRVMEHHAKQGTMDDVVAKATALKLKGEDWNRAIFLASQEVLDNNKQTKQEEAKKKRETKIREVFEEKQNRGAGKQTLTADDIWNLDDSELSKIDLSKL